MKINGMPGEFGFRALVQSSWEYFQQGIEKNIEAWTLTQDYFLSKEDAEKFLSPNKFKWPIEVYDNGTIYIPAEDELK